LSISPSTGTYAVALLKTKEAQQWIEFLKSPTALEIFERFGFKAVRVALTN
jgi:ABC-type molybdate transport system substrate-binding protein